MHAIPECLRGVFMTRCRCYTNPRLSYRISPTYVLLACTWWHFVNITVSVCNNNIIISWLPAIMVKPVWILVVFAHVYVCLSVHVETENYW